MVMKMHGFLLILSFTVVCVCVCVRAAENLQKKFRFKNKQTTSSVYSRGLFAYRAHH